MKNFKDDTKEINDPLYSKLFENVITEKVAPIKQSVDCLAKKAGYTIKEDDTKLEKYIEVELNNLFAYGEVQYPYESIKDIKTLDDLEAIQQKIYSQSATVMDKLAIQKY